jgi:hypothetical protein
MQVNSAQDYLTAQKRRIVAASFANTPPAPQRKYNYVYLSILANKATQYNKTPYPQTLSTAPGSVPGLPPQSQWTAPGTRPKISDCVNCPTAAVPLAGTLV